jgi:phage terminase large subunit-like protein
LSLLPYLKSIEHTRGYKLNYDNDPAGREGDFWNAEDIRYGIPAGITKLFIFVDPPVTQKTTSDDAGIAVVGYVPASMASKLTRAELALYPREFLAENLLEHEVKDPTGPARLSRVVVLEAFGVKATGANLKKKVLDTLARWPRVQAVILENNQGADLWLEVFNDLPVRFITFGSHEKKEVRFSRALDFYQKRRVTHASPQRDAEDQMTSYPKVAKDDIMDAISAGVLRLLIPKPAHKNKSIPQR